ncbi:MAG TPA: insulinase family protein [Kofleriaceae bacterium]|nr:insulinase family protein [Kofleriaceae bacterium]
MTLENSLRVVVVRDPTATEVQVTIRYHVGAIDDGEHPGMAHLVEHLMFQQQLDGQPLFTHLEDTATYFNAATTFDATTYTSRAPTTALDKLLAIEATRLEQRCKTIGEAEFVRERDVVVNELKQRDQTSAVYAAIHSALYPEGHPYRRLLGGSVAAVGAITREQSCAFADAYYAPGNAVLVVSGPLTRADVDTALTGLGARITKRAGATPHRAAPEVPRPQHLEVSAPIDEDILVLAWPLPLEPELQTKVRAIGAALPRLVDAEIKGSAVRIELGDRSAPMLGLAVLRGDDETFQQAIDGARRGIAKLPDVFRERQPENLDDILFDRIKQGAIYDLYSTLEDGSDRDERLASYVSAGREPRAAMDGELQALRELAREEAADLASRYLAAGAPAIVTLKASTGKKRGHKTTLRAPIHDLGQRRTPVDPAAANRPATGPRNALAGMRTRVLPNGLKVVLLPVTSVPTFQARLIFGSGTASEPAERRGVALLAAHALTWDLRDFADVASYARAGGMRDVDVAHDRTSFAVQGLDMNLDVVLAGLRRWVRNGVYDDSAATFVNAMRRSAKRVDDQGPLTDAWRTALFGAEHPYVTGGIVRHANNALTLDDAWRFRAAHYTPDNATLVIAGRFDAGLADRWIDFLFAGWGGRAEPHRIAPAITKPASIAKVDDTELVQLRIALPTRAADRAQRLVAAEMLNEIAHEVRYRLGASYTLDAQLAETRLASFIFIAGWVDAARATAAVGLIRDRVMELRRDATAAARAFVIARGHVLTALRSRVGSADALAARVERDVELAREPLSDLQTALAVEALTIADMTPALPELDLARATVLMNGPSAELTAAFKALDRTPIYVQPPPAAPSTPGTTAPAFKGEEQHVYRSELRAALTEQPPPRRLLTFSATSIPAGINGLASGFSGYSFTAGIGYRYGWTNGLGVRVAVGRVTSEGIGSAGLPTTLGLIPIDVLGLWHLGTSGRNWTDVLLGLHLERLSDASTSWRAAAMLGLHVGYDVFRSGVHRVGIGVRLERTMKSDIDYAVIGIGLVYRQ